MRLYNPEKKRPPKKKQVAPKCVEEQVEMPWWMSLLSFVAGILLFFTIPLWIMAAIFTAATFSGYQPSKNKGSDN